VPHANGPIAFIVGSAGDVTHRQVEVFAAQPGFDTQLVDAVALIDGNFEVARKARSAAAALIGGFDTMIAIDRQDDGIALALAEGKARHWDARQTIRCVRNGLVAMSDVAVDSDGGGTVVLSGGDVARAFCERRGIEGLELIAEVAPGIPISRAIGANLYVVTKAGGYGHENTYLDIAAALHAKAVT
jgi:D-threonate/D-erythronate kinase